jgi:siroheme synthase (precorrin-2 oxidase/ferrochelatase)
MVSMPISGEFNRGCDRSKQQSSRNIEEIQKTEDEGELSVEWVLGFLPSTQPIEARAIALELKRDNQPNGKAHPPRSALDKCDQYSISWVQRVII